VDGDEDGVSFAVGHALDGKIVVFRGGARPLGIRRVRGEHGRDGKLLAGAHHSRQDNRQVPVAVYLAGPLIGGLLLQLRATVSMVPGRVEGRAGANRVGAVRLRDRDCIAAAARE